MATHCSVLRMLRSGAALWVIGLGIGCDGQSEIPLAKVPPPPPDFGKPVVSPKTPKGGSPENAVDFNRGASK